MGGIQRVPVKKTAQARRVENGRLPDIGFLRSYVGTDRVNLKLEASLKKEKTAGSGAGTHCSRTRELPACWIMVYLAPAPSESVGTSLVEFTRSCRIVISSSFRASQSGQCARSRLLVGDDRKRIVSSQPQARLCQLGCRCLPRLMDPSLR